MKNNIGEKGFTIIELLIVSVVIVIAFTAVTTLLLFSRSATQKAQRSTEAISYTQGALEAVRKLRDDGWSNVCTTGTYYLNVSSNQWNLVASDPDPTSFYKTTVVISNVNRDGGDNIVTSGGTLDHNTKQIVAKTTWNENGTKNVTLSSYITNFKGDTIPVGC